MISEKEKIQLKLEIYKDILDCFPCPTIDFLNPKECGTIDISSFKDNLEDKIDEIIIKLNIYNDIEKEKEHEKYKRNKSYIRINNKKRKN